MASTLIKNGTVISMDPAIGDLPAGDVLIEDGIIKKVETDITASGAEVIDAGGMIVMPGLINAHIHTWMTGLRGIGGDWAGWDFFRIIHKNLAMRYTPEDNYYSTLMGSLSQLDSGVTTIFEWCHNNKTPGHSDASIDGLVDSGIRAVFGHGTVKPKQKEGEPHFSEIPHPVEEVKRLREGRLSDDHALVTLAICVLGPDYGIKEVALQDFRMAKDFDILSSAHIWGRDDRVVKDGYHFLAKEGLLGPKHNVVHGNFLDDEELKVIVDSGASITSTPTGEMQNRSGEPLVGRVKELGGYPSIGADIEVFAAGDMFYVMRFSLELMRVLDSKRRAIGSTSLEELNFLTRDALQWATINNARALCLDDRIGSLTPGKQADVILLRGDDLNVFPVNDPLQTVVLQAYGSNVDTVLVAGRKVKEKGKLLLPPGKLAEYRQKLLDSTERLFREGGLK